MRSIAPRAAGRRTLASATVEVDALDPSAVALASRLASDRWFAWEQPDASGFALACLGSVARGRLPRRGALRRRRARLHRADPRRRARRAAGLPAGRRARLDRRVRLRPARRLRSSQWSSLPPALMVMPRALAACGRDGRSFLTLNALVEGGEGAERALDAAGRRLASLSDRPIGPLDPSPVAGTPDQRAPPAGPLRGARRGRDEPDQGRGAREGGPGPRGRRHRAVRARPGTRLRRAARGVPVLLQLRLRHARGRLHRRQPRAPDPPPRRRSPRRSRSRARCAAAPTPPSTTTSASSC